MCTGVTSVAVVPVGVTKYREGLYPLRTYTGGGGWCGHRPGGGLCVRALSDGIRRAAMFWCSDEFYLHRRTAPCPEDELLRGLLPAGKRRGDAASAPGGVQAGALMTMDEGIGLVKPLRHCHRCDRWPAHHPSWRSRRPTPAVASSTDGVPHPQRLFRADHHRFRSDHRQRPHRPASGQTPGGAAAAAQLHAALS